MQNSVLVATAALQGRGNRSTKEYQVVLPCVPTGRVALHIVFLHVFASWFVSGYATTVFSYFLREWLQTPAAVDGCGTARDLYCDLTTACAVKIVITPTNTGEHSAIFFFSYM